MKTAQKTQGNSLLGGMAKIAGIFGLATLGGAILVTGAVAAATSATIAYVGLGIIGVALACGTAVTIARENDSKNTPVQKEPEAKVAATKATSKPFIKFCLFNQAFNEVSIKVNGKETTLKNAIKVLKQNLKP
jgi:hypothetical protein